MQTFHVESVQCNNLINTLNAEEHNRHDGEACDGKKNRKLSMQANKSNWEQASQISNKQARFSKTLVRNPAGIHSGKRPECLGTPVSCMIIPHKLYCSCFLNNFKTSPQLLRLFWRVLKNTRGARSPILLRGACLTHQPRSMKLINKRSGAYW